MNKQILRGLLFICGSVAAVSHAADPLKFQLPVATVKNTAPQTMPELKVPVAGRADAGRNSPFKMPAPVVLNITKSRAELDGIIQRALK